LYVICCINIISNFNFIFNLIRLNFLARVRKFTLGASVFLTLGSIAVGSQIGFFTGTAAGIKTVKSLPSRVSRFACSF